MSGSPRVLSIQSHVVFGYVGNKSATFPLQLMGFDVDSINSVHLSNHTGYKIVKGQKLKEKEFNQIIDGLKANRLDKNYTHLITGYVATSDILLRIAEFVKYLKNLNPNLIYSKDNKLHTYLFYFCDPVMGDNQKLYVTKDVIPIYKNHLLPLSDIITPNHYELELIGDKKIVTLKDAQNIANILHEKGPKAVVLSSIDLGDKNKNLTGFASLKKGNLIENVFIEFPKISGNFTGTGDLFTALFTAWMYKTNNELRKSLENTIAALQSILIRTHNCAIINKDKSSSIEEKEELKIVQSKSEIEIPEVKYFANKHILRTK